MTRRLIDDNVPVQVVDYPLGSSPAELQRLDHQGALLAPATRMIFEAAGIQPGMRVLDLGSGAGDVSFVAADLVGPTGEVIGIDRSPDACARAALRAQRRDLPHARFIAHDIETPLAADGFDAIVGRLVLMYFRDPAAVLRTHAASLRRGGLVVPIEIDVASARAIPPTPLLEEILSWIITAFTRANIHAALGTQLWTVAQEAGLQPRGMIAVQPHFGPGDQDGPTLLAGVVRAILPLIERSGAATAEQVGIDSLRERLSAELSAARAVFAHPLLISAWATAE
jgi:SAM-dependent methyltransferase